jgi:GR25 family glycosyltransferase involved in LPS biosynthesis
MDLSKMKTTICLNMIVKNESHIITKTLNNLCSYINFSYWVICDTGSTDNTKELIKDFFKDKKIDGELVEHKWKDFGHNRSKALKAAYNKTDYVFIFDADDEIFGDFKLPTIYDCDKYTLKFGKDFVYFRPLLFNNRKKFCFKGVLHEYLSNIDEVSGEKNITGNYYIESGRTGNRSQNPNKYIDDANILKKAHYDELEKDYNLSCRYAFYCAQSYKDSGPQYMDDAIEWYKKCLGLNMWLQEKYHSCFTLGDLYMSKKDNVNALKYWYKTIEYDSERIEGIVNAVNFLRNDCQHLLVNALYHKFKNYNKNPQGKLFLFQNLYEDQLEYHNAISAFYVNDKETGYECCKKILINKIVPYNLLKSTINNFNFYIDLLKTDTNNDVLELFYSIDSIISDISSKNEVISEDIIKIWNALFEKNKPKLTKFSNYSFENRSNPKILLTFTTCKRFDLFKQTINSMLNHWLDIDKIDYWFCVDDNSSEKDRNSMKVFYPWINYYNKTIEEKGHIKSMNIIWDKLNELKPTYWIHMEDDFLFHNKMNYIEEAINAMNNELCTSNNVKQVLFNRNYGETIENYNTCGHIINNEYSNIALHNFVNKNFPYQNCHYWPHYSFRPSLIDVKTILELGNYDSENTFFEMDYANKWTKSGYTSAFFNKITNRHIGRLTSDRGTKNVKNAYELNDENQFYKEEPKKEDKKEIINISTNINIKIINLERRPDRKEETIKKLENAGINKEQYEFIKAVDGQILNPTQELFDLFKDNDFGSRKGFIGCALSHYNLWKQLLDDKNNEYYLIMEDDFSLCTNFKDKIESLNNEFISRECLFLGYHMFEKNREIVKDIYDNDSLETVKVTPLNKDLYIGGTFCYSINKNGAKKMINYIQTNGIKHGIDYVMKIANNLECNESQPHLVFSEWNESGKKIDSDIQNIYDSLDLKMIYTNTSTNTSYFHRGRLGNLFFVNMALHFISKKNNLYVEYQFHEKFKKLGVKLFTGEKMYNETIKLSDNNFFEIVSGESINKNVSIVNDMWCQTCEFSHYLKSYFDEDEQKNHIIKNNIYKERYNTNNDVFVHIRLGDIIEHIEWCQTFEYYDKILANIKFDNGYISSDSIDYYICKKLIKKYNLQIINTDEISTIMFGSTCKYIVLSGGTFSWIIGFLAYYSEVYYPKIIHKWHGDIFVFKTWNEIEYEPIIIKNYEAIKDNYIFIQKLDQHGNDVYYHKKSLEEQMTIAFKDDMCAGFNTLGFFKNKIDLNDLRLSPYFGENDGLYIKKEYYENQIENKNKIIETNKNKNIRVKMLCNWCSSEQLCKEWSNMCEEGFIWKNIELVWTNKREEIDYYVIINFPPKDAYFEPSKTIVFQMEPWVNDVTKNWGVKTWGEWADPDPDRFLRVFSHKTNLNAVQWQINIPLNQLKKSIDFSIKQDCVSCICSSKNYDEGHILRNNLIKYIEDKEINIHVYGRQNYHNFKSYVGPLLDDNKFSGFSFYKYCFNIENNSEYNYATEKLWEPILCESLCFYYGCPNVTDYIDSRAFVLLDINDFEKSYQIIKQSIEADLWSQRIDIIRQEKQRILNELAFFPTIQKTINETNIK